MTLLGYELYMLYFSATKMGDWMRLYIYADTYSIVSSELVADWYKKRLHKAAFLLITRLLLYYQ